MQINAAYLPKTSEQARLAAMAAASLLLQEAGEIVAAKKARSLTNGSRWNGNFGLPRNGGR